MPGWSALNAATTASSAGICSSFSPVPSPTYHSISTVSPDVADAVLDGAVDVDALGLTADPHAARTNMPIDASAPNRKGAHPGVRMILLLSFTRLCWSMNTDFTLRADQPPLSGTRALIPRSMP
jgi:hypothetical protein